LIFSLLGTIVDHCSQKLLMLFFPAAPCRFLYTCTREAEPSPLLPSINTAAARAQHTVAKTDRLRTANPPTPGRRDNSPMLAASRRALHCPVPRNVAAKSAADRYTVCSKLKNAKKWFTAFRRKQVKERRVQLPPVVSLLRAERNWLPTMCSPFVVARNVLEFQGALMH